MSKSIVYIAMTLDGFIAGKNDDLSWLMPYSQVDYGYKEFYDHIGAIILGRRTYDYGISHWDWPYSNIPAFVLSTKMLENVPKGAEVHVANGDVAHVLAQAKSKTANDIWIGGGAHLAQEFLNRHLVDELIITIVPVLLGDGIRLFENLTGTVQLEYYSTKTYDLGMVQVSYLVRHVADAPK